MTRLAALAVLLLSTAALAAEPVTLKLGTLAPRESPWGLVLRAWAKQVKDKSQGQLQVELFWNATQGDEAAQIAKVKTGQLDGAVVTAVGLGLVDPNVNVLQLPGVFSGWAALDKVRDALRPRFEKSFAEKGFLLAGWGDVGLDRLMAKGFAVKAPADLKGKRPWVWRDDLILPPVFQVLGVTPVATSVPEALPELSTGNVNAMSVSPLGAEQLQWSSRLDHLNPMVVAPNIGGVVLAKARVDALPKELQQLLLESGEKATKALTERIREEDRKAFDRLTARMTVDTPGEAELKAWAAVFQEARARLAKGTFPQALVQEVESLAK